MSSTAEFVAVDSVAPDAPVIRPATIDEETRAWLAVVRQLRREDRFPGYAALGFAPLGFVDTAECADRRDWFVSISDGRFVSLRYVRAGYWKGELPKTGDCWYYQEHNVATRFGVPRIHDSAAARVVGLDELAAHEQARVNALAWSLLGAAFSTNRRWRSLRSAYARFLCESGVAPGQRLREWLADFSAEHRTAPSQERIERHVCYAGDSGDTERPGRPTLPELLLAFPVAKMRNVIDFLSYAGDGSFYPLAGAVQKFAQAITVDGLPIYSPVAGRAALLKEKRGGVRVVVGDAPITVGGSVELRVQQGQEVAVGSLLGIEPMPRELALMPLDSPLLVYRALLRELKSERFERLFLGWLCSQFLSLREGLVHAPVEIAAPAAYDFGRAEDALWRTRRLADRFQASSEMIVLPPLPERFGIAEGRQVEVRLQANFADAIEADFTGSDERVGDEFSGWWRYRGATGAQQRGAGRRRRGCRGGRRRRAKK